jgi:hypothetical protein
MTAFESADIASALRRELRQNWVRFDPIRVDQMIQQAMTAPMPPARAWAAPRATAATVVAVAGAAAAIAAASGSRGPAGARPRGAAARQDRPTDWNGELDPARTAPASSLAHRRAHAHGEPVSRAAVAQRCPDSHAEPT